MTPEAMRRVAMERLRERARRIGLIRRSVIAAAVATFALAWGLALSDQIAHGTKTSPNDPTASASATSGVSSSDDGETDAGVAVSSVPATVAPSPAPLTTSQS